MGLILRKAVREYNCAFSFEDFDESHESIQSIQIVPCAEVRVELESDFLNGKLQTSDFLNCPSLKNLFPSAFCGGLDFDDLLKMMLKLLHQIL